MDSIHNLLTRGFCTSNVNPLNIKWSFSMLLFAPTTSTSEIVDLIVSAYPFMVDVVLTGLQSMLVAGMWS